MTTISTIISDAMRESNLIAVGSSPTDTENTEALRLLNRYLKMLFGTKVGENFEEFYLGKTNVTEPMLFQVFIEDVKPFYIDNDTRLVLNMDQPYTVDLIAIPEDGSRFSVVDASGNLSTYNLTIRGNGRLIEGSTELVLSTNGISSEWFYRADTGNWSKLTDLTLTDISPFPEEFDDMLILGLAMRLNPRQGAAMDPASIAYYREVEKTFRARYSQTKEMATEDALLRLTYMRRYWGLSDPTQFNRGYPRW